MQRSVSIVAIALSCVLAVPSAYAQNPHTAPQAALDAAIQERVSATAADREEVLRALDRQDVKAMAGQLGIDLRTAKSAIRGLDGEQLAQAAAQAKQLNQGNQALAGGASTVVISTTTIVIGLLLLILIIVAT